MTTPSQKFSLREKRSRKARYRLTDMEIDEVSIVDSAANGKQFILKNDETPVANEDGELVVDIASEDDVLKAVDTVGKALPLLRDYVDGKIGKDLDISETARQKFYMVVPDIWRRMDQICTLLDLSAGSVTHGTLDSAIGSELMALSSGLAALAEAFGVTEIPESAIFMSAKEPAEKAGKVMSKNNLKRLGDVVTALMTAYDELHSLFGALGGADLEDSMKDAKKSLDRANTLVQGIDVVVTDSDLSKEVAALDSNLNELDEAIETFVDSVSKRLETLEKQHATHVQVLESNNAELTKKLEDMQAALDKALVTKATTRTRTSTAISRAIPVVVQPQDSNRDADPNMPFGRDPVVNS